MRAMSDLDTALPREADHLFAEYFDKIERTAGRLTVEQIWWRPNAACNSVGNLLLHLSGNLSQWVLAGLGGESFERRRDEEFAAFLEALNEGMAEELDDRRASVAPVGTSALFAEPTSQGSASACSVSRLS